MTYRESDGMDLDKMKIQLEDAQETVCVLYSERRALEKRLGRYQMKYVTWVAACVLVLGLFGSLIYRAFKAVAASDSIEQCYVEYSSVNSWRVYADIPWKTDKQLGYHDTRYQALRAAYEMGCPVRDDGLKMLNEYTVLEIMSEENN